MWRFASRLRAARIPAFPAAAQWLFLGFFLAFAVKVPLFPFHTWLPDAHVEAPTAGSVLLAGVLLKMGTYGMLRFNLGLFPEQARANAWWIMILALIGIIYGALVAMVQPNMKKLIAYSSVSHLGFVVLGIFSFTQAGLNGAIFVMLAHGVSTGALFMLAGVLHERRHTYEISEFGGLASPVPVYAASFLFVVLASVGLPLLNGFVGEFLVLSGAFQDRGNLWDPGRHRRDLERHLSFVDVPASVLRQSHESVEQFLCRSSGSGEGRGLVMRCSCAGNGSRAQPVVERDQSRGAGRAGSIRANRQQDERPMTELLAYMSIQPQSADYVRILPEIVLSLFGIVVMLLDPLLDEKASQKTLGLIALLGTLAGLLATWWMSQSPGLAFWNMVRVDGFSVFFHFLVIAIAAVVILTSYEYMAVQRIRAGEYYALILFGVVGMALMSSAVELVLIFIALEISSISSYVLVGFRRNEASSSESSLKYFLLGSFATAFFLYGIALMFGATGSTNIEVISKTLQTSPIALLVYVAVALMFVGLGFKVAAAPFHIWTPDVYEGAPAPIVGFMSTAPKAAAFAVLLRIVFEINAPGRFWLVWVAAALSMTLGNVGALVQNNVKRLLAYSSIAHAGYLLVAFAAAPELGVSAVMFYTAAYAAMNVGAFAVVSHFANAGERYVTLKDYEGLGRTSPLLAAIFTVFLLSLIGIPMTGGFFAKFYVFSAAVKANLIGLTIIGVLNSGVGAYYYLRIIVAMYMREPQKQAPVTPVPLGLGFALAASLVATLYLGIWPSTVLRYAQDSAQQFVQAPEPSPLPGSPMVSALQGPR